MVYSICMGDAEGRRGDTATTYREDSCIMADEDDDSDATDDDEDDEEEEDVWWGCREG